MADAVKVTLPSGAVVTCSAKQAAQYKDDSAKASKAPAKKAASNKSEK